MPEFVFRNMIINARAGMTQGWTGSLDKLEDLLKNESHSI
jgi:hypothetical protein